MADRDTTEYLNHWARVHPQVESSDGGVDFELLIRTEFPIKTTNSPHGASSSLSEGKP